MQGIAFAIIFLSILLLPGFALSQWIQTGWVQRSRFLFSLGFSYAVFALVVGIFQTLSLSFAAFLTFIISALAITGILSVIAIRARTFEIEKTCLAQSFIIPFLIVLVISIYHLVVSAYSEIPADIYAHLGYFQRAFELQQNGSIGEGSLQQFFMQKGLVWYHLLAFCANISGASIEAVVELTTWLTKTLFLLSVYFFCLSVFKRNNHANLIAILGVIFLSLHMGINVFAFIRYYSFAPAMLNFILYFSAVVVFLNLIKEQRSMALIQQLFYIAVLVFATAAVHTQETLFIIVICSLIALVDVTQSILARRDGTKARFSSHFSTLVLLIAVLGFAIIYVIARQELTRAPNVGWRLWEFGVINEWLPKLTILNLKYQFIRVITLWGLLVYIAAIFYWRDIRQNAFLVAGLISPLFTLMNPFFVDLFLRLDNSTTLWRMSYLIPLHFIAAFLVVKMAQDFRLKSEWGFKKVFSCVFIVFSVALLMPFKNTYAGLHYSRFPTLISVDSQNGYDHLTDAISALKNIGERHIILTDPVTGYVVSGMTHHHSYRHKFLPRRYLNFTFEDYSDFPLRKHKGKLLLVNARSGKHSEVGGLSRHWSENVLDVSPYYPQALKKHLASNPKSFSLLWKSKDDDMRLYKIL